MKSSRSICSVIQWGVMAALAGTFAGCGGGGGGGVITPPGPTLVLTAANRDTVSHATAGGIVALSSTTSIPVAASSSVSERKTLLAARVLPASAGAYRLFGALLQPLQASTASSATDRERPLAVIGPQTQTCAVSGTTTGTVDDRDGSNSLSAGDVVTVVFNNCVDTPGETMNGTTVMNVTGISASTLNARLTYSAFSDVTAQHALTLDGSMLFALSTPSTVVANIKTTADGPVVATVTTHVPFSDTVTLQSGFAVEEDVDMSVPPPVGAVGTTPGRTITTLQGRMQSAAAGGDFDVATLAGASMTKYHAEDYPRSGVVKVKGKTGSLTLTALSASAVQIDLDANDDGTTESSVSQTWDWLF